MNNRKTEQLVWNSKDFDSMSWHDCSIYGMALLPESFGFVLDIDFIAEWLCSPEKSCASFNVAPCTLVMENIGDLRVDLRLGNSLSVQINRLTRSDSRVCASGVTDWLWRFECHSVGEITLRATGFRQYSRKQPIVCAEQSLDIAVRGGISFALP